MSVPFRNSDLTLSDIEEGDETGLLQKGQKHGSHGRLFQPRLPTLGTAFVIFLFLTTNFVTWNTAQKIISATRATDFTTCPGSVGEPPKLSRVLRELDVTKTHPIKFDSTFHNYGSPYRGPPGPETDAVWENEAGAAFGYILIPSDEADEAGITPDHLRFDGQDDQEGLEGYPAHIEVFHQIHCLNLLRMSTWYNSPYYMARKELAFKHPENQVREHVDHCIDNLRQRLMCTVDVGIIPFYWVNDSGRVGTDPDFQQSHTCRDFDKLHAWMKEHTMDMPSNRTIVPHPGSYQKDHFT